VSLHDLAGQPAPASLLVDVPSLIAAYYSFRPDPGEPLHRVAFGTSGHRGSSLRESFNEPHVLAVTQAICEQRAVRGIDGPLFLGKDTHALSEPAFETALEVLAAHAVEVRIDAEDGYTPTPAISHAILCHNRGRTQGLADGIVITPSHNPPEDGGFKYNPPNGGPADTEVTSWIERRANQLLAANLKDVQRVSYEAALRSDTTHIFDFVTPYVDGLETVLDMKAISRAGLRIGVDPMGGAGIGYWPRIAERYGLRLEIVNETIDPTFSFMTLDHDGKIRMDCSSPYAMARLVDLRNQYDIAFGNDTDFDRHGIVTSSWGLLNPNHYLSVAISYLFTERDWDDRAAIGKTLVSSAMIDRVAKDLRRRLAEVPVGFKWFVRGLLDGSYGFGGEESAGASFLRKDGSVWTTDKDGILLNLLAAEITATMSSPRRRARLASGKFPRRNATSSSRKISRKTICERGLGRSVALRGALLRQVSSEPTPIGSHRPASPSTIPSTPVSRYWTLAPAAITAVQVSSAGNRNRWLPSIASR